MRWQITYYVSVCVCDCAGLFGNVLTCGFRWGGRRDWEADLRVKNLMIILESIEFSFFILSGLNLKCYLNCFWITSIQNLC